MLASAVLCDTCRLYLIAFLCNYAGGARTDCTVLESQSGGPTCLCHPRQGAGGHPDQAAAHRHASAGCRRRWLLRAVLNATIHVYDFDNPTHIVD